MVNIARRRPLLAPGALPTQKYWGDGQSTGLYGASLQPSVVSPLHYKRYQFYQPDIVVALCCC